MTDLKSEMADFKSGANSRNFRIGRVAPGGLLPIVFVSLLYQAGARVFSCEICFVGSCWWVLWFLLLFPFFPARASLASGGPVRCAHGDSNPCEFATTTTLALAVFGYLRTGF